MNKQVVLLIMAVVFGVTANAIAGIVTWTGGAGTSTWSDMANWTSDSGQTLPNSGDDLVVPPMADGAVGPELTSGTYAVKYLRLARNAGTGTTAPSLTASGGSLSSTLILVGDTAGKIGTLNVAGGAVSTTGYISSGQNGTGHINVTSGSLSSTGFLYSAQYSTSTGNTIVVSGGTLATAGKALISNAAGTSTTFNISGAGTVNIALDAFMGFGASSSVTLNMSDSGVLNVAGYLSFAQGTGSTGNLNMTGGQINITGTGTSSSPGTLFVGNVGSSNSQLSGGTITAKNLTIRSGGVLTLSDSGTLILTGGDFRDAIALYISQTYLRAGAGETISAVYDPDTNLTTVTAIPVIPAPWLATPNLTKRLCVDAVTGLKYYAVGLDDVNTCHMYFTAQTWTSDSKKLILCTNIDPYTRCDYVMFNTDSNTTIYLDQDIQDINVLTIYNGVVSSTDHLYYHRYINSGSKPGRVYDINLNDPCLTRRQRVANPDGYSFTTAPSISNDGTTLAVCARESSGAVKNLFKINTSTGAITKIIDPTWVNATLDPPAIDHPQVNPVYNDIFFYCHNYNGQIWDRIWTYNETSGVHQNLYQQQYLDGNLGEYVGHEMWSYDGEKLYFVKYNHSPIKPTGIMWVDAEDGGIYGHVNGDHDYLHMAVSPDGKWAVADTVYFAGPVEKQSDIYLIDLDTKKSKLLARVNCWTNQPGHVHPSFSPDSKKVTFTFADLNNNLWVGYMDIGQLSDFSSNGIVNFADFAIFANYWMDYMCVEPDWCEGCDYDQSGKIDSNDLVRFVENWLWHASWYEP